MDIVICERYSSLRTKCNSFVEVEEDGIQYVIFDCSKCYFPEMLKDKDSDELIIVEKKPPSFYFF
jgi:hypothetical protein